MIQGIKCYAPDLAFQNSDYPVEEFKFLYEAENKNFWFISRNRVIQHLFKKYIGAKKVNILEIGCGTGYVLKGLEKKFPKYTLKGSEIHVEGIKFAQKRLPNIEFVQLDATEMPFENEFDAIGAFDVLEHIEEDEKVMEEVNKSLKSKGYFIISVPQYQWMWSITDAIAFHKRRYHRKELKEKLEKAGFELKYMTSFVFTLFPMMYLSRLLKKKSKNDQDLSTSEAKQAELNELKLNPLLNSLFLACMKLDEWLIKLGVSLAWGGSLMAVAQKKEKS